MKTDKLFTLTQALLCFGVGLLLLDKIQVNRWQQDKEKVIICSCGRIGQWNKNAHKCNIAKQ